MGQYFSKESEKKDNSLSYGERQFKKTLQAIKRKMRWKIKKKEGETETGGVL